MHLLSKAITSEQQLANQHIFSPALKINSAKDGNWRTMKLCT